jgi:hypothetical protein
LEKLKMKDWFKPKSGPIPKPNDTSRIRQFCARMVRKLVSVPDKPIWARASVAAKQRSSAAAVVAKRQSKRQQTAKGGSSLLRGLLAVVRGIDTVMTGMDYAWDRVFNYSDWLEKKQKEEIRLRLEADQIEADQIQMGIKPKSNIPLELLQMEAEWHFQQMVEAQAEAERAIERSHNQIGTNWKH